MARPDRPPGRTCGDGPARGRLQTQAAAERRESALSIAGDGDDRSGDRLVTFQYAAARLLAELHYRASKRGDRP